MSFPAPSSLFVGVLDSGYQSCAVLIYGCMPYSCIQNVLSVSGFRLIIANYPGTLQCPGSRTQGSLCYDTTYHISRTRVLIYTRLSVPDS